jgi:tetratricopeptide (TPR) repeat protein
MKMKRAVLGSVTVTAFLAVTVVGCKNPQLSGGILHFDQKRYERARETLIAAIQQEPNNAEAHFWLGKAYAELDSTQQARATLDKAAELAASGTKPEVKSDIENAIDHYWSQRHNEGLSFAKAAQDAAALDKPDEAKKNWRLALNQFKKARIYNDKKEETPRNMGVSYFNLAEIDSGLAALRDAQALAPGDEKAADILFNQYRNLGDQAAEKGMSDPQSLKDAVRFYQEAEKIRPTDSDLLFSIGVMHYQIAEADTAARKSHYGEAVSYFERAIEGKPDDQEALFNASTLHLELKSCDKGIVLAKRLLDLNPREGKHHDLVGRLSDCLGQKNDRVAGLVFSRALQGGEVVPLEGFKEMVQSKGAQSDLMRRYREEGSPEEVRSFKDASNREYMAWFYWTRGKALAFYGGEFKYQTSFKPQPATP